MGKRIISQRRGRGTLTYKSHSHRHKGKTGNYLGKDKKRGVIVEIIHNPGHNAPNMVVDYEGSFVLSPAYEGARVGDFLDANDINLGKGNLVALENIPEGTSIFNIEGSSGKAMFCKSAGVFSKVVSRNKKEGTVTIRLPSKKEKILNGKLRAMLGIVAGAGKKEKPFLKAGKRVMKMKAKGKLYPRTSGVAMNAVDHPFGSGRGRHIGKPKNAPRFAPPGRNVGLIRAKKVGKKK